MELTKSELLAIVNTAKEFFETHDMIKFATFKFADPAVEGHLDPERPWASLSQKVLDGTEPCGACLGGGLFYGLCKALPKKANKNYCEDLFLIGKSLEKFGVVDNTFKVESFNDHPNTTKEDVIMILERWSDLLENVND